MFAGRSVASNVVNDRAVAFLLLFCPNPRLKNPLKTFLETILILDLKQRDVSWNPDMPEVLIS